GGGRAPRSARARRRRPARPCRRRSPHPGSHRPEPHPSRLSPHDRPPSRSRFRPFPPPAARPPGGGRPRPPALARVRGSARPSGTEGTLSREGDAVTKPEAHDGYLGPDSVAWGGIGHPI